MTLPHASRTPPRRRELGCTLAAIAIAGLLHATDARAQAAACRGIANDAERLACYDRATAPAPAAEAAPAQSDAPRRELGSIPAEQVERRRRLGASLTDRWELDEGSNRGTFLLRPYKPMYLLPVNYTSSINKSPSSPAPAHASPPLPSLDNIEAKYQISLKAKVGKNLFGDNGDLWFGYTQSSRWQVFNNADSAPFRETNYEPEAMLVFRTDYELLGFRGRMIGVGLNHQSNGRALPLSRSWNRITADFGFERDDWMLIARPWWRLKESSGRDDNPGIENYIGRGELLIARKSAGHVLSLQARHSLRGGEDSRGSLQLAWAIPISSYLKAHLQFFSGYGESLIDYNHRQTTFGLGVSLVDWF